MSLAHVIRALGSVCATAGQKASKHYATLLDATDGVLVPYVHARNESLETRGAAIYCIGMWEAALLRCKLYYETCMLHAWIGMRQDVPINMVCKGDSGQIVAVVFGAAYHQHCVMYAAVDTYYFHRYEWSDHTLKSLCWR